MTRYYVARPAGALLTQRSLALRSGRTSCPGGSHPRQASDAKTLLVEQGFCWSVIEDSEPPTFVPNEVRYRAAPITKMRAHLTAQARPSILSRKIRIQSARKSADNLLRGDFLRIGIWHQLLFWLMPPSGDVYPGSPVSYRTKLHMTTRHFDLLCCFRVERTSAHVAGLARYLSDGSIPAWNTELLRRRHIAGVPCK